MVNYWDIKIPELTGEESRKAYIYLPDSYQHENAKRYPVLYMFDGHNVFFDSHATYVKCWGMKEYMDKTGLQLIIVAVECNHSPDFGRLKEYAPFTFSSPEFGTIAGKGRVTMNWFVDTLKPEIDQAYRTFPDREHTFIAGSSMGGLMSLYAVLEYNHVFSRAGVHSPSLWTDFNRVKMLIRTSLIRKDTVVYMDYGELEAASHPGILRAFQKTAGLLLEKDVLLTCRIVPDGYHNEATWEKQLPFMLQTITYGIENNL